MARDTKLPSDNLADDTESWLDTFLADEQESAKTLLWRLGSWGVGAVAALTVAIAAAQAPERTNKAEAAAAELADRSQQLETIAQETRQQTRRLSAAVETLNKDRDRMFARLSGLEQGLESVTGSIQRSQSPGDAASISGSDPAANRLAPLAQAPAAAPPEPLANAVPAPPQPSTPSVVAASAGAPALQNSKSDQTVQPPNSVAPGSVTEAAPAARAPAPSAPALAAAASKPTQPAPAAPTQVAALEEAQEAAPVPQTRFGLDLGGASSMEGLRALWKGVRMAHGKDLPGLYPVLAIKPGDKGLGLQVHVVAGPIADAASAAKLCAILLVEDRTCETTIFDGQRLSLDSADKPKDITEKPRRSASPSRSGRRKQVRHEAPPEPPPPPEKRSTISSMLGLR